MASGRGCYALLLHFDLQLDCSTYTKVVQSTMAGELSTERERKYVKRVL